MVDKTHVLALIADIRNSPPERSVKMREYFEEFKQLPDNFEHYVAPCNTAACIGGWTVRLMNIRSKDQETFNFHSPSLETVAREFLGLANNEADDLFYFFNINGDEIRKITGIQTVGGAFKVFDALPDRVRKSAAIYVLEGLYNFNRVDWKTAIELAWSEYIKNHIRQ